MAYDIRAGCGRNGRGSSPRPPAHAGPAPGRPVKVILAGGDEKQARSFDESQLPADVELVARFHPGMKSSWNKTLRKVKHVARHADAIAMTTDVRTEFGRRLKAWARDNDVPLEVGFARGQRAIEELILRARDRARCTGNAHRGPSPRSHPDAAKG